MTAAETSEESGHKVGLKVFEFELNWQMNTSKGSGSSGRSFFVQSWIAAVVRLFSQFVFSRVEFCMSLLTAVSGFVFVGASTRNRRPHLHSIGQSPLLLAWECSSELCGSRNQTEEQQ